MNTTFTYEISSAQLLGIFNNENVLDSITDIAVLLGIELRFQQEYYSFIDVLLLHVTIDNVDFDTAATISALVKTGLKGIIKRLLASKHGEEFIASSNDFLDSSQIVSLVGSTDVSKVNNYVPKRLHVPVNEAEEWDPFWGHDDVNIQNVNGTSNKDRRIQVVLIGTGVDETHQCLQGGIVNNMSDTYLAGNVYNWGLEPADWQAPSDQNGHGTAVAALVCGKLDTRYLRKIGMADNVEIRPYKFAEGLYSTTHRLLRAICLAIGEFPLINGKEIEGTEKFREDFKKPEIILLTGTYSSKTQDVEETAIGKALLQAMDQGVAVVVAAGNTGRNAHGESTYPAPLPGVISVGAYGLTRGINAPATAPGRWLAGFSNNSRHVTLFAPGYAVPAAVPVLLAGGNTDDYNMAFGTSYAAPFVAGALAASWDKLDSSVSFIEGVMKLIDSISQTHDRAEVEDTSGNSPKDVNQVRLMKCR